MPTPNIVVIMADQLAPQFTGAYGHPVVKTPHMEALAKQGMRFDAAYCNSPLCAPSRAAFMTGQLVSRIGTYDNAAEFAASIPTFAHYLRSRGYRTCLSGKMHFVGPDQLHGFEERLTTDVYPADFAWTPDWDNPDRRIEKWYHNMESVQQAGPAATSFQIEFDEETTFLARRRIFDYAMQGTAPFAMVVSLMHPHDPYVPRPEFWDLYDPEEIDMPQTGLTDDPQTLRLNKGIGAADCPVTDKEVRNARHGYYANTSYFDSKIGEIVKALKESDQYENTIIIITSDHGDMLGERGLWYKMNFFEHSARIPMIISGPGVRKGTSEAPVSLVDLLPTFLDIADQSAADLPETPLDGRSLWPLLTHAEPESTDRTVFGDYCGECTSRPLLMIRRGAFKYIHTLPDAPLLYNVLNDPFEQNNLSENPEFFQIVESFKVEAAAKWNENALYSDVLANQKRRRPIYEAMEHGSLTSWDYQPRRDAAQEYVRNHQDWTVAAERMRYPPIK